MKKTIFTLTAARSGTLFLRNIFRLNATGCTCRHETFFDFGNPTMFGPAIYDAYAGRIDKIRERLKKKRDYIEKCFGATYLESSHAFLKSAYLAAPEIFPDLQLIHLIRDPLKVAASEAYREQWRRCLRAPFHFYKGDDGKRHFVWALTGNEDIFKYFDAGKLSLFQWYLLQWIEIENRAMNFLGQIHLRERCFTLDCPRDLNSVEKIRELFDFLEIATKQPEIIFGGRKNKSIGYSPEMGAQHEKEFALVVRQLPKRFLEIFQHEPYSNCDWIWRFGNHLETKTILSRQYSSSSSR